MSIKAFIDKNEALASQIQTKEADMPQLAGLEELQAQLSSAVQEKVELSTAKTQLEAALADAIAAKAAAESLSASLKAELDTFKLETIESTRKTLLASVLPEDQVESVLSSTKSLDAASFEVVFGALKAKAEVEEKSFAEVGYQGAEASAESPLDKLIAADKLKSQQGNQ